MNLKLKMNGFFAVAALVIALFSQAEAQSATAVRYKQIATGAGHSLALTTDGSVVAWGDNSFGQLPQPSVTIQPLSQAVPLGLATTLSAVVTGIPPMSYQWRKDGADINGATGSEYTLTNAQNSDAGAYSVVITNPSGTVTSSNAVITVVPLLITQQPENETPVAGWTVDFSVAVSSGAPLSYQWRKDGNNIPGATSSLYTITNAQSSDVGSYSVLISNEYISVVSSNALLTLSSFPPWSTPPGTVVSWGSQIIPYFVPGTRFTKIAAGGNQSLAIKSDGSIVAWGQTWVGNAWVSGRVPPDLTNVAAIAAGYFHSLAIKSDGNMVAWGSDWNGESTVPSGLNGVVAIAGGYGHSLALKSNGAVVAWGQIWNGSNYVTATVPVGLDGVIGIAAGHQHNLALKSDGRVVAWGGENLSGETTVPAGLDGVLAVAAGFRRSLALKADGMVVAWGSDGNGGKSTVPDGLTGVVAIAAGVSHSLALKSDGTIVAWGNNEQGQSTAPGGLTDVVATAGGGGFFDLQGRRLLEHRLALKSDGTVVALGWDTFEHPNAAPEGLNSVVSIAAGNNHSLALKSDGTVVTWGQYWNGSDWVEHTVPAGLNGVVAIAAGGDHSLALKADATVVAWGDNAFEQSVLPEGLNGVVGIAAGYAQSFALVVAANQPTVPAVVYEPFSQVVPIGSSPAFRVLAVGESLNFQWMKNGADIIGATNSVLAISNAQNLDAGIYSVLVTNDSGRASSADAALTVVAAPPHISLQPRMQISRVGRSAHFGATVYGAMPLSYQWRKDGININGATNSVFTISNVQSADAGSYSMIVTNAYGSTVSSNVVLTLMRVSPFEPHAPGTVVSWGSGAVPVPTGLTDVVAIAAGGEHSLALKSDGTVVGLGNNGDGQSTVPTGLTGVVGIAAGGAHNLALKSDGTVVAWGYNGYSQSTVPNGLNSVVAIAAGGFHSLALKFDGTVVAWGYNVFGQSTVPTGLNGVVEIAAGHHYSMALVVGPNQPTAPAIGIHANGNNVLLAWPVSAAGYSLQSTTNLADPDSWTTLATPPVVVDLQNRVTDPISGPANFYRLKK